MKVRKSSGSQHHRSDLERIAVQAMRDRNLLPDVPQNALEQLASITGSSIEHGPEIHDLADLAWCSIDNDDSYDLDQLSYCELIENGAIRLLIAVADVDSLVKKGTPIDEYARTNTATVYTSARIFPMLPLRLSTDLTSLNQGALRMAIVTEMNFNADAHLTGYSVFQAVVMNKSKLAYDAVSRWLEGRGPLPEAARRVNGIDVQLRLQDQLAQKLRSLRKAKGALEFETFQPLAIFDGEKVVSIEQQVQNRARQLIEEFMIAANGCNARFLYEHKVSSFRRVVRSPERWLRIVEVAGQYGDVLPPEPNSIALEEFLARRHLADPLRFPDLSLVIVKLLGSGEYVVEGSGTSPLGHFGLALREYTHSTAPNRRYPDLITTRLIKAVLGKKPNPYTLEELEILARHCTHQEDSARKVERRMRKSDAALLLEPRLGEIFSAVVTGNEIEGIWIRLLSPPVEGKLIHASRNVRVGDKVTARLISTDVERGYIDFAMEV